MKESGQAALTWARAHLSREGHDDAPLARRDARTIPLCPPALYYPVLEPWGVVRAVTLFQELVNIYRGTSRADQIYYYYAKSMMGQKDYLMATHYFKSLLKEPSSAITLLAITAWVWIWGSSLRLVC